jgi:hypothetical protein
MKRLIALLTAFSLIALGVLAAACNRTDRSTNVSREAPLGSSVSASNDTLVVWFYEGTSQAQVDSFARSSALVALSDSGEYGVIFKFLIDRSIVPAETTADAYALNLKMSNPRLVRYAHVLGQSDPDPPPSTEEVCVAFYERPSDLEVRTFAQANGLIPLDNSRSYKVFRFALDRSVVPADTTAAMYAEKLKREYPDLIESAFPQAFSGQAYRAARNPRAIGAQ